MSRLGDRVPPRRLILFAIPIAAVVGVVAVILAVVGTGGGSSTPVAKPGVSNPPVNDITCDPTDHKDAPHAAHLTIMIKGKARDIMPNVGIANAVVAFPPSGPVVTKAECYYWLHTGRDDGVIHADPPAAARHTFTLGDFFDIWHQPLGTSAVGSSEGKVSSYVNGQRYAGNPRSIPLDDHAVIQLDVGRDVPPSPYSW